MVRSEWARPDAGTARRAIRRGAWLPALAVAVSATWSATQVVGLLARGRAVVAAHAGRFVRRVRPGSRRVLVVGDSSAAGVGASSAGHSVAGQLAACHPSWSIGNLAFTGCRTAQVARLLVRLRRRTRPAGRHHRPYDLLIVHVGGIDALHGTPLDDLRVDLLQVIGAAAAVADETIIVSGGNLALAPGLPAPLAWWIGRRSRQVRELFRRLVPGHHVRYLDRFRERDADPTAGHARRYVAADGLHPSDENDALWVDAIDEAAAR